MSDRRYGGVLAATVLLLGAGAAWAWLAMREGKLDRPLQLAGEGDATFTVRNRWQIRPDVAAYERYAAEDSVWRLSYATSDPYSRAAAGSWAPSPEQTLRDTVYRLTQAGRLAEAAAELEQWLRRHPNDRAAMLELARLELQLGQPDDAFAHYRALLARGDDPALRREYAAALLAAGRYAEAAREYGNLVAADSASVEPRLGLARALAWGDRAREAEPQLRWLAARLPGDTTVTAMLHAARASYDPSAAEAADWLEGDRRYAPYRLALARALGREGRQVEAAAQLDTLVTTEPASPALLAEAASAHAAAGDSLGTARLLGRAVLLVPADTSLRRRWAEALAWSGDRSAAIAQYSVLLAGHERADLYLARGRLRAWGGELDLAARDLVRSAELEPSYDALSLLGDVERWRGRYGQSRTAYQRALALRPGDPTVLASLAALAREERLLAAAAPGGDESGWTLGARYAEDNTGFLFVAAGLTRGFALGRATVLSATAEQRRISLRSATEPERYVYGVAIGAELSRWIGRALHASVQAGEVRHGVGRDVFYGGAGIDVALPARAHASVQLETGPLYEGLMSLRTIASWRGDELLATRMLTGQTATVSASVPLGPVQVAVGAHELRMSDGNRRRGVTVSARVPIGHGFSAVYTGGTMGYSARSDAYWDPTRYTSHAAGVEWAWNDRRGLSVAARVLPGVGSSDERLAGQAGPRLQSGMVGQLSTGGEASLRRGRWDVGVGGGYGRGREGGYQSLNGTLRVKVSW